MLCEKCKKRTATVFYNENMNGKIRALSLCGECAAKLRELGDIHDITSMMGSFAAPFSGLHEELFGGFFGISSGKPISPARTCPTCGISYAEIEQSGRVGCPDCYTTFENELSRMLRSVHGTTAHNGEVPSRHRAKQEREQMLKRKRQELKEAIQAENFEQAAQIRDEIRALENNHQKEEA